MPGATGTRARIPGYLVAGKTGTASKLVDGQYTSYNSGSFIGMAPADHPRVVIGVYADVPNGSGGQVAAPAFSDKMSTTLWHYQVPPTTARCPPSKSTRDKAGRASRVETRPVSRPGRWSASRCRCATGRRRRSRRP